MEKIYDAAKRSFTSLDALSSQHIVAAGGDYWMMKNVTLNTTASTCYKIRTHQVSNLTPSIPISDSYGFFSFSLNGITSFSNEVYDQIWMNSKCM